MHRITLPIPRVSMTPAEVYLCASSRRWRNRARVLTVLFWLAFAYAAAGLLVGVVL
jgi:hypothetical protein